MLSLFDGLDCGKKLFVITCNDVDELSDYLLNRPGRFHYHFMLSTPSPDEIREYLNGKLIPEYRDVVEEVVNFSAVGKITYDCLRAIAFELNQGYSLAETVEDLNIARDDINRLEVTVEFNDGSTIERFAENIDLCSDRAYGNWYRFYLAQKNRSVDYWFSFKPSDLRATRNGTLMLEPDKLLEKSVDKNDIEGLSPELQATLTKKVDEVKRIVFARPLAKRIKYII